MQSGFLAVSASLNLNFHRQLVEGSGNQRLLSTYDRLLNELHLFRRFGLMQRREMQLSNREHHQILEKIAAGDPNENGQKKEVYRTDSLSLCFVR
jgi:DNA-binding GntR family transcriptional regulator